MLKKPTPGAGETRGSTVPPAPAPPPPVGRVDALVSALAGLGCRVHWGSEENMIARVAGVRRIRFGADAVSPSEADAAAEIYAEVHVSGFANLLHEVGHLVQRELLDHDHGIDYTEIPFDLQTESGRRMLFEELTCCVLSCCFIASDACEDGTTPPANVVDWFREQVEIQPVFYGMEGDLAPFWDRVCALARANEAELERTIDQAIERTSLLLRTGGVSDTLARPPKRYTASALLRAART